MTEDKEQLLVKEFPKFFRDYHGDPTQTCMAFGMECMNGWFELFYNLNKQIQQHLTTLGDNAPDFYWSQVKEKYGGARWYYNGGDDVISDLVHEAENKSEETCEVCGAPGKIEGPGWYSCRCENCRNSRNL